MAIRKKKPNAVKGIFRLKLRYINHLAPHLDKNI